MLVNICDSDQIRCTLCGAGLEDLSLDEYISSVMKRYVLISLNFLCLKLIKIKLSFLILSQEHVYS